MTPFPEQEFLETPGVVPPRQARSQRAQNSILDALNRLLLRCDYQDINVSDIAKEAGCAVGGVYNRFASKDHILLALAERVIVERVDPRYEKQETPHWEKDLSVREFLEIYLAIVSRPLEEFRHIFRPLAVISRYRKADAFSDFLSKREKKNHTHLTRVIGGLASKQNPDLDESAVKLAVFWVISLYKDYVLFGEKAAALTGVSDDRYFSELAVMIDAFLTSRNAGRFGGNL